jgi:hypothetical protein
MHRRSFIAALAGGALTAVPAMASLPRKEGLSLPTRMQKDRGLAPESMDLSKAVRAIEGRFHTVLKGKVVELEGAKRVSFAVGYQGSVNDKTQLEVLISSFYFSMIKRSEQTKGQLLIWESEPGLHLDSARGTVSLRASATMV